MVKERGERGYSRQKLSMAAVGQDLVQGPMQLVHVFSGDDDGPGTERNLTD